MRSDFTVLTVAADENLSGLLPYMIESVRRFTDPCPNIIVVDNNINNHKSLMPYIKDPFVTIVKNHGSSAIKDKQSTSYRHGDGLNVGMKLVNTPYTAIIESDCVVCNPNWHVFDTNKYDMIVAKKGVKSEEEYYHMFFMMFKTELFRHINWTPSEKRIAAGKQSDTGCEALDNLPSRNKILCLDNVACGGNKTKIFNHSKFYYKSMELWNKDQDVVAAHFGRGSDMSRRKQHEKESPGQQCKTWKRVIKHKLGITMPRSVRGPKR